MQRYFVANEQMTDQVVTIKGDDVKHIVKVMRMAQDDEIICINETGQTTKCKIITIGDTEVTAEVIEFLSQNHELPVNVTIAQGLPKGDKLDLIVQKGTELGASAFIPFDASRSIVKWDRKKVEKKVERLSKIAKEAAEQSYRQTVPSVQNVVSFKELLTKSIEYDVKIVAYEEQAKSGETSNLVKALNSSKLGSRILVVIGPEGGLTEDEIKHLERANFILCGFGPRILRTETASLYLLSAVSYHFEMLR